MLFDLSHSLYLVISTIITIIILTLAVIFIKDQKKKDIFLRFFSVITVIIHYSSLYVDYFNNGGSVMIEPSMLLAIYPCNICMWLVLICSFIKNKQSLTFRIMAEFTFYCGIIGGTLGIAMNEIYANNPNLADWSVLKGLLSHSTMLISVLYLLCGKYIKIRVFNVISCTCGALCMLLHGHIINFMYDLFNLSPCNSMYLINPPFSNAPWFNTYVMGVFALILVLLITIIYEQIALKKEDRWYSLMKNELNKRKNKGE